MTTTPTPSPDSLLREAQSTTINALAEMAKFCMPDHLPDRIGDLEVIPRDPVMEQVTRIRGAWDKVSLYLAQHPQSVGAPVPDGEVEAMRMAFRTASGIGMSRQEAEIIGNALLALRGGVAQAVPFASAVFTAGGSIAAYNRYTPDGEYVHTVAEIKSYDAKYPADAPHYGGLCYDRTKTQAQGVVVDGKHWVFDAARAMRPLASQVLVDDEFAGGENLSGMLDKIEAGMSPTKACRWLGWVQACVYMHFVASLEELKAINKAAAKNIAPQQKDGGQ